MIEFKEIFTQLTDEIHNEYGNGVSVMPERVAKPASFPAVWCVETDTYSQLRFSTLDFNDDQRRSVIEIQTFSNLSSGATAQAQNIMEFCEKVLKRFFYRMTTNSPVENLNDATIKRRIARFERVIGGGDKL